nr:DUF6876 family protein [Nitrospirillum amazonense]
MDEIALAQRFEAKVAAEEFQVWALTVHPDHTTTLRCEDGNDGAVFEKAILHGISGGWRADLLLRRWPAPRHHGAERILT